MIRRSNSRQSMSKRNRRTSMIESRIRAIRNRPHNTKRRVSESAKRRRNLKESFSSYDFIDDMKHDITADMRDEDIEELVWQTIDNAVIYYSDCFKIMQELQITDWRDADGDITCIADVAVYGLELWMYTDGGIRELYDYRDELAENEFVEDEEYAY